MSSKEKNNEYKITSFTAGNYQSLIIFLQASDFEDEKVNEEVWKIRNLLKITDEQESELLSKWWDKKSWIRRIPEQVRLAKQEVLNNKKDLMENIRSYVQKNVS